MLFEDLKIVVTGGAGGIGALLVRELIDEGADVLVIDRAVTVPAGARSFHANLAGAAGIAAVTDALERETPDILINLAGAQYFGALEHQETDHIHMTYMVNLVAPVLLTRAVLPAMKARQSGHIVNIGSVFASINYPHFATYSSAKAGLRGFSEALRRELSGFGIDVTYVAPRAVRTGLNSGLVMRFAELVKMRMDDPAAVVRRILAAIRNRETNVVIGYPERFFVRLNALMPGLVDNALAGQTAKARTLLQ